MEAPLPVLGTLVWVLVIGWLAHVVIRRLNPGRAAEAEDLEAQYQSARERGDIATADQVEAQLRDLEAPGWFTRQ